jgi:hypothetical protein
VPLNREIEIFASDGVEFDRSTLPGTVGGVAAPLESRRRDRKALWRRHR